MTNEETVVELMRVIIKLEKEYIFGKIGIKKTKSEKVSEIKKIIEEAITREGGN